MPSTAISSVPYSGILQSNPLSAPLKYVVIDGVRQINPAYKEFQKSQGISVSSLNDKALPIVSTMEDHQQLREASKAAGQGDVPLAKSTDATIDMMQEQDISRAVGLSPDAIIDELGAIFAKYEVPIGLMNKLFGLTEYQRLEFIIDDSGSMNEMSDATNSRGQRQTRWEEAKDRMKILIEIMAYVPTPQIKICFLNRPETILLQRNGETPTRFIENAHQLVDGAFSNLPRGGTPILNCLRRSFQQSQGQKVARYLFCDGVPDGGVINQKEIANLLATRPDAQGNPFTFLSCSDRDDEVRWMKEVEEVVPYCSELDDYKAEGMEVRGDQGDVFPFSKGFYLISQLVGAMNPDDLDAMDESVPFTKETLDNLLGVKNSEQDYRRYFDGFVEAQRKRSSENRLDQIKKRQNWEPHFRDFVTTPLAKNIQAVKTI